MNIITKTFLKYITKSFSLRDASSFNRAFETWRLGIDGEDLVGWVAAATNVWGTFFTKAKFRVYENTSQGLVEQVDNQLMKVMRTPNDYQTQWEMQYQLAMWWVLYGSAYWLKLRGLDGKVLQLVQLKPWLVDVITTADAYIDSFEYRTDLQVIKYDPADIIYLKVPSTSSFVDGRAIISGFLNQLEVDQFQTAYQKKFYQEGGFAGRTFTAKNELGKNTFDRILESLREQYGGEENSFKVALLEMIEPVKAAYSMKEMDISNQRLLSRDEILGGMQVPKIMLGIGDDISKGNAETAVWQFASGIVDPYMSYVDSVLTSHVIADSDNDQLVVIHDVIAPKDADQAVKIAKDKFSMGALTLNEVREIDGKPKYTFPLADKPLINLGGNMINLEDEEIIGVAADVPDNKPDSNPGSAGEDDDKKSLKEVDRTWKQFDRRRSVLAKSETVLWKQFFSEQEDRLLTTLNIKAEDSDLSEFYLSDEEMLLLNTYLFNRFMRSTEAGFDMGQVSTGGHSFYNPDNKFVRRVLDGVNAQALGIQKRTLDSIRDFLGGDINNLSNAEMTRVIRQEYGNIDSKRVPRIVNTTITAGLNAGLLHAFQEAGFTKKRWVTEGDDRVRNRPDASHVLANTQTVDLEATFLVSGEELLFPADPHASAKNAVNCRCTMIGIK